MSGVPALVTGDGAALTVPIPVVCTVRSTSPDGNGDGLGLGEGEALGDGAEVAVDFAQAVAGADAAVITTPWPEIREVPESAFTRAAGAIPVIDPWGLLQGTPLATAVRVTFLGRGGAAPTGEGVPVYAHSGTQHR